MDYNENFNIPVPSLLTDMDVEAYKKLEITMSKEEKSFLKIITINAAGLNDEDLIPSIRGLKMRKLVISGDTAPLHFSRALGVNVIGLFGIYGSTQYAAPIYSNKEKVIGGLCLCTGDLEHFEVCKSRKFCMETIQPKEVVRLMNFK